MWLVYLFLVIAGVLNTVQAGANSTLHKHLDHPVIPAILATAGALVGLAVALVAHRLATRAPLPTAAQWAAAPWWAWTGGLLGCTYVLAMVNLSDKVGASVFTGLTVTAGILTSIAADHFGWVGFAQHTASVPRLCGAGLMIAGVVLIGRY